MTTIQPSTFNNPSLRNMSNPVTKSTPIPVPSELAHIKEYVKPQRHTTTVTAYHSAKRSTKTYTSEVTTLLSPLGYIAYNLAEMLSRTGTLNEKLTIIKNLSKHKLNDMFKYIEDPQKKPNKRSEGLHTVLQGIEPRDLMQVYRLGKALHAGDINVPIVLDARASGIAITGRIFGVKTHELFGGYTAPILTSDDVLDAFNYVIPDVYDAIRKGSNVDRKTAKEAIIPIGFGSETSVVKHIRNMDDYNIFKENIQNYLPLMPMIIEQINANTREFSMIKWQSPLGREVSFCHLESTRRDVEGISVEYQELIENTYMKPALANTTHSIDSDVMNFVNQNTDSLGDIHDAVILYAYEAHEAQIMYNMALDMIAESGVSLQLLKFFGVNIDIEGDYDKLEGTFALM